MFLTLNSLNILKRTKNAYNSFQYFYKLQIGTCQHNLMCFSGALVSVRQASCTGTGLEPVPGDCNKYQQCDNGVLITQPCPPTLHFNAVSTTLQFKTKQKTSFTIHIYYHMFSVVCYILEEPKNVKFGFFWEV